MMLAQIANYCAVITRNTIIKNSTSITSIWQSIRAHFGFQSTGSHFLDLAELKLENEERPEDLSRTLASIKPEISQALSSLLDELNSVDEGRVMRMSGNQNFQRRTHPPRKAFQHQNNKSNPTTRRTKPVCPICKEARYSRVDHFLSSCPYLPESDKKYLARTRLIHSLSNLVKVIMMIILQ